MHKKIILYGAGKRAQRLIKILEFCGLPIDGLLDSDTEKWGKHIENYLIESPDVLEQKTDYTLCITVVDDRVIREIRNTLQNEYLIDLSNEITYEELIIKAYESVLPDKNGIVNSSVVSKKTIIFDCDYGIGLGGVQEWTKDICREFVREGEFNTYILTAFGDYDIPKELANNILYVDVKREEYFMPSNISKIVNCIVGYMPCILVPNHPNEVLLAGKILKKYYNENIQIISVVHNSDERLYNQYCSMSNCTDLFLCVSSDIQRNMLQRGIDKNKVSLMICPTTCPDNLEHNYTIDDSEPIRIGYAGRLVVVQKRMDLLLKLVYELEKNNVNYYIELAGEGSFESTLKEFISKNHLNNKIKLVGKIDKEAIPKFWADKDICINIADHEGRSRSISEAMANGAVPIVTKTSGVNDDIVDGENGYIVNIGDYVSMAKCIKYLQLHRELLKDMGYKAHIEIKQKSSMEKHYTFWKRLIS